jgi:hypothetical protein
MALALLVALPAAAASGPEIQFTRFGSASAFGAGTPSGVVADGDVLILAPGEVSGTWVSPSVQPGRRFSRLVASWNADTPGASRLRVEAQATTSVGETSNWYVLGIWAAEDRGSGSSFVQGVVVTELTRPESDSRPLT